MNYTIWMTGLSGSGKSTIADKIKEIYPEMVLLDGDVVRNGLCSDLGFSNKDRKENMRRLRELCWLFNDNDKNVITAFISPFEFERILAKQRITDCHIVYCNSDLETCEKRDVKGLYKKAREGIIPKFTGISSPFEKPECADLILDTQNESIDNCTNKLIKYMEGLK